MLNNKKFDCQGLTRRATLKNLIGMATFVNLPSTVWAKDAYPSHPIRMVVPFPPGGGFDTLARPFAEKLSRILQTTIVVDNKGGAGGNIGTAEVARAAPDGYTILFGNEILGISPLIYKKLTYDSVRSFQPIAMIATTPIILAINPNLPAKDLKGLITLSEKEPITFGTPGIGTSPHLLGELLNQKSPLKLRHVPYRGTGPAITDALSGQINAVLTVASSVEPYIKSGKLRGIALLGNKRSSRLPNLPTIEEAGLPGYTHDVWYALLAPTNIPAPVVDALSKAAKQVLQDKELTTKLVEMGFEPMWANDKAVSQRITSDLKRWGQVVFEANIHQM